MFNNNFNFNFNNNEKETISEEIRKLVTQTESLFERSSEESGYLAVWKTNLLKLSGNN